MSQRAYSPRRALEPPPRARREPSRREKKPERVPRPSAQPKRGAPDGALLLVIMLLILFGLVMLFSASFYSVQETGKMPWATAGKQAVIALIGFAVMMVAMNVDYFLYRDKRIAYAAVGLSIVLLILVLFVGQDINGSRRWFLIPIIDLSVQPGEIAKVGLIVFMAHRMSHNPREVSTVQGLAVYLGVVGVMFALVYKQPNLSTAVSLGLLCAVMLLCGGARLSHMVVLGALAAVMIYYMAHAADYRASRMMSFRDPFNPEIVRKEGYQLAQSLLSLGSGGLWGVGLGHSRQKLLFLPYADSDFIFAIIAEEIGLIGCVVVLALFFVLVFLGMRVAFNARDVFGSMLAAGLSAMIGVQVVLNVAVVSGLIPTTGLPLPFFSAGGTSLVIIMASMGVLLNISRYAKRPEKKLSEQKI